MAQIKKAVKIFLAVAAACLLFAGIFFTAETRASETVPYISAVQFAQVIAEAKHPVVVQFGADWCPYCRRLLPVLESLAAEKGDNASVYRINVDDEAELTNEYAIKSLPTVVLFVDGREIDRRNGESLKELSRWVEQ